MLPSRYFKAGFLLFTLCLLPLCSPAVELWRTGYYPQYAATSLPPANIDFTALTHVVHFSVLPNADGSLDTNTFAIFPPATTAIVSAAHSASKKALICIGGAGSSFPTDNTAITNLVARLRDFMVQGNYDGIDVDWEPLPDTAAQAYTNLVKRLRTVLNAFPTPKLLASAIQPTTTPSIIASVKNDLDQANLMTYDISGPYDGWVTWFDSPIYDGGYTFPSAPGELVPSIDGYVSNFINAGIPTNKLGIGVAFYGYVWAGGNNGSGDGMHSPRQSWTSAPSPFYTITYNQIISSNFPSASIHFDTAAQEAWVGIDGSGTQDMFISYDDIRSCEAKISYIRNRGLGGIIIWELTQDHVPNQLDPLLQAIKTAVTAPGIVSVKKSGANTQLNFSSAPLGSYRVSWATNLASGNWNSLAVTNLSLTATNATIQINDSGVAGQTRFYRIQSPP